MIRILMNIVELMTLEYFSLEESLVAILHQLTFALFVSKCFVKMLSKSSLGIEFNLLKRFWTTVIDDNGEDLRSGKVD